MPIMDVLVAEYASCGGAGAGHLLAEGQAVLYAFKGSFARAGHRVEVPLDITAELAGMASRCDAGLLVAPDHLLADLTEVLEAGCENLGSPPEAVRLAADKLRCAERLRLAEVATSLDAPSGGQWVIKPRRGCGSEGVRCSASPDVGIAEVAEPYVQGEHLSVCLVASRSRALPVCLNRQQISIDGRLRYLGGLVNVGHPRRPECLDAARRAVEAVGLRGPCGVDIVLADRPYVVDVNPRATTSFVGLAPLLPVELAQLVVRAREDDLPGSVDVRGSAGFTLDGLPAVEVRLR